MQKTIQKNKAFILNLSESHNSFYLYDESAIVEQAKLLQDNFEGVEFLYSLKANPHPQIVQTVLSQGLGIDAASLGEVNLAHNSGAGMRNIFYSAPGKSVQDIKGSLGKAIIIADSLNEIECINEIAAQYQACVPIGVRINPDFTFWGNSGIPSKFGIDQKQLFQHAQQLNCLKFVKIVGIHVHSRSQELNATVIENYYQNMFALAKEVENVFSMSLEFINLGGGLGIPYSENDEPLNTIQLGKKTTKLSQQFKKSSPKVRVLIETGRFLVGKAGVYVTKVMDIKQSYQKTFIILNNTLNGFLRPSLGQLITSSSEKEAVSGEPLFTKKNAFQFEVLSEQIEQEEEEVTLVGNLCTATDIIAKDIQLPKLHIGDMVIINNAGSYAATLAPLKFSSLIPSPEFFLTKDMLIV